MNQEMSSPMAPTEEVHKQLFAFYGVSTKDALIAAQMLHIEKLQAKLASFAPVGRIKEFVRKA